MCGVRAYDNAGWVSVDIVSVFLFRFTAADPWHRAGFGLTIACGKFAWTWSGSEGGSPDAYPPFLAVAAAILLAELAGGVVEHIMLAGIVRSHTERQRHEREEARILARAR